MPAKPIRLLVVDDHKLLRSALCRLIQEFGICSHICQAADGFEALELMSQSTYDVIIVDIQMPGMNGIQLLKQVRKHGIQTKVVILTQFAEESLIIHLMQLGVDALLFKNCDPGELENVISKVCQEGHYYDGLVLKAIQNNISREIKLANLNISPREFQVMMLLKDGKSNKEIAKDLGLTLRTVESYRKGLIKKTNCRNTVDLISLAYRTGLMPNNSYS